MTEVVIPFERLGMHDVETVGGKNASIGEMIGSLSRLGVKVPGGFATTSSPQRQPSATTPTATSGDGCGRASSSGSASLNGPKAN